MKIHVSEHYMRVLTPLKMYNPDYSFGINFKNEDKEYIERILEDSGYSKNKLIGLCPCARHNDKDWTIEETAKFISYINQNTEYKAVIVGD